LHETVTVERPLLIERKTDLDVHEIGIHRANQHREPRS